MLKNVKDVKTDELLNVVSSIVSKKCRFVTMTSVDCGDHFDILYHFDENYKLLNLRLKIGREESIPSIGSVCPGSIIVENEIQDLYGIKFDNLALDYQGRFYLADGAPEKPLCRVPGVMVTEMPKKADKQEEGEKK